MSQQWYCQIQGKTYGPVAANVLQEWAHEGRLAPTDMIKKEGGQWIVAQSVKGLAWPALAPEAAPVATPVAAPAAAFDQPWQQPGDLPTTVKSVMSASRGPGSRLSKTATSWTAIFDWKFDYFLTPWIVRIFYLTFLVVLGCGFVLMTLGVVFGIVSGVSKTMFGQASPAITKPSTLALLEPTSSTAGLAAANSYASASSQSLTAFFAQRSMSNFSQPSNTFAPVLGSIIVVIVYLIEVVAMIIWLLMVRMGCEMAIVAYRIAEDIGCIKRKFVDEAK